MNFECKKFGDFITLQRGYDLTKNQIVKGNYPVVCSTSIMGYHNKYKANGPGVVIGRSGTLGQVQYIEENYWPHNTSLFVKDFKENYPKFVYYFLKYFGTDNAGGGSAVPTLNRNALSTYDIKVPDIETQHKIADILSSYDDLIENNQKQIKLLEEAAERLYKEWFVNLHFPNYENTPIVDGIPQGWINKKLENIKCELESGSRPKGGVNNTLINGIPSLGAKDILELGEFDYNNTQYISKEYYENMKRGKIKNKDILIYKDGAYIGKTTLFQDYFPYDKAVVNEHVFLLHAKDDNIQYYLFFTLHQKEYFIKMQNLNKNSAQPGLNQKNIMSIDILMPNNYLIEQFNEKITPMMKEIFILANSITKLQEARNRLLPKLMSGEIEV